MEKLTEYRFYLNSELLANIPDGLTDIGLEFGVHEEYRTVWPKISKNKITFYKRGAEILKSFFDFYGTEGDCPYLIQGLNVETLVFENVDSGVIDFEQWLYDYDLIAASVGLIASTNSAKLVARDKIMINPNSFIDLDGNTVLPISQEIMKIRPIELSGRAVYPSVGYGETNDFVFTTGGYGVETTGGDFPITVKPTINGLTELVNGVFTNSNSYPIRISLTAELSFYFKYKWYFVETQSSINVSSYISLRASDDEFLESICAFDFFEVIPEQTIGGEDFFSDQKTETITDLIVNPGASVSITAFLNIVATNTDGIEGSMTSESMELFAVAEEMPTSYHTCFTMKSAFETVIRNISQTLSFDCPLLNTGGKWENMCIISGMMLRGFSLANKPFTFSLRELFLTMLSKDDVALFFNPETDEIILDYYVNFHDTDIVGIDISNEIIADFTEEPAQHYLFNEIKIGDEKKIQYESTLGTDEFNVPTNYSLKNKTFAKVKNWASPFNSDGFAVENARRASIATTGDDDTKYDGLKMVLDCYYDDTIGDSGFVPKRYNDDTNTQIVTGVYGADTRINLLLSPAHSIYNHIRSIKIALNKFEGIQFNNSATTSKLETSNSVFTIYESSDIDTTGATPVFYPILYKFKCKFNSRIYDFIDIQKMIKFAHNGIIKYGHIEMLTIDDFNGMADFIIKKSLRADESPVIEAVVYVDHDSAIFTDNDDAIFIPNNE